VKRPFDHFAFAFALLLLVTATTAAAQIVPVSQDRWVYGYASIDTMEGSIYGVDSDTASGFDHFQEGAGVTIETWHALSSGSATQNSDILPAELRAYGSAAANSETYEYDVFADSYGQSRYDVVFDLADTVVYRMTGMLEAYDNGDTYIQLKKGTLTIVDFYASYNETTPVSVEDTLYPGQYRLFMNAYASAFADGAGYFSYGFSSFDIRFQVATSTGIPTGGSDSKLFLSVAPNPIRSETVIAHHIPAGGTATIDVFDLAGRRVRTLQSSGSVVWDGRDDSGRNVAPGIYFVRLLSGETKIQKKVTVLR